MTKKDVMTNKHVQELQKLQQWSYLLNTYSQGIGLRLGLSVRVRSCRSTPTDCLPYSFGILTRTRTLTLTLAPTLNLLSTYSPGILEHPILDLTLTNPKPEP